MSPVRSRDELFAHAGWASLHVLAKIPVFPACPSIFTLRIPYSSGLRRASWQLSYNTVTFLQRILRSLEYRRYECNLTYASDLI